MNSEGVDRAIEDLKGSFAYGWAIVGAADVVIGTLGTMRFLDGADLNDGRSQVVVCGIVLLSSVIAFFSGSQFRATRNRRRLMDDVQALVNTYRAAAEKTEREAQALQASHERELHDLRERHASELDQRNHEMGQLTTRLESERSRATTLAESARGAEEAVRRVGVAEARVIELEGALDSKQAELVAKQAELDERQAKVDATLAELDAQRHKNAELAARWEAEHSEAKRKLSVIAGLSSGEAHVLSRILEREDAGRPYVTTDYDATLKSLEAEGMVRVSQRSDDNPFSVRVQKSYECVTKSEWRDAIRQSSDLIRETAAPAREAAEERERKSREAKAEKTRNEHRRTARGISPDNKLLLLYLADRGTVEVSVDEFKLNERLRGAEDLVEYTEVGWDLFSLELSARGRSVVECARDILADADPCGAYLWWHDGADQDWEPTQDEPQGE